MDGSSNNGGTIIRVIDNFVDFKIGHVDTFQEIEESLRTCNNTIYVDVDEAKISILCEFNWESNNNSNERDGGNSLLLHALMHMLKCLQRTIPNITKLTFDSGLSSRSYSVPIEAIKIVLTEFKSLTRLDVSYIHVVCRHVMDIDELIPSLEGNTAATRKNVTHICLDRCSLSRKLYEGETRERERNVSFIGDSFGLDALIQLFVRGLSGLEWLTICPEDFETLSTDTLSCLAQKAPSLKELMLWNFNLQSDPHVAFFFMCLSSALSQQKSQLIRLTLPSTLSLSGAQAVRDHLRQPNTVLQGLTLTINNLVSDQEGLAPTAADVKKILTAIADGLQVNQSLQSFRIRGAAKVDRNICMPIFANALKDNYYLKNFSVLHLEGRSASPNTSVTQYNTAGGDASTTNISTNTNYYSTNINTNNDRILTAHEHALNIEMYLKLNHHDRRNLMMRNPTNKKDWMKTMIALRNDLNCIFHLLQLNPSLCLDNQPINQSIHQ